MQLRLWLGRLLFHPLGPIIFRVSLRRVIKEPCDLPEVEAMQFVVSHTRIPIPKLYAVHVAKMHTSTYHTHFTHADLCPRNIVVMNEHVAAIIDWGFAGWYPEYWEF